jgi:phage tail-like protein
MTATGERNDPFMAFIFTIKVAALAVGGFSECSGLQLETEFFDYNEGGVNDHVHKLPTRTKQNNITLKRGVVDSALWDWYWALVEGNVQRRTISIVMADPSGQRKQEWQLIDALPSKWVGPDFNATQNSVAIETLELSYQRILRS